MLSLRTHTHFPHSYVLFCSHAHTLPLSRSARTYTSPLALPLRPPLALSSRLSVSPFSLAPPTCINPSLPCLIHLSVSLPVSVDPLLFVPLLIPFPPRLSRSTPPSTSTALKAADVNILGDRAGAPDSMPPSNDTPAAVNNTVTLVGPHGPVLPPSDRDDNKAEIRATSVRAERAA